jgi:Ca2+/Na+ antiporter
MAKSRIDVIGNRSSGGSEDQEPKENEDDMFEHQEEDEEDKLDWQQIFLQEKMMGEP